MKNISNPIIPIKQEFYDLRTNKIVNWETNSNNNLDLEAIVSFCSLGFMLDDDTFYNDIKVCKPATEYRLNEKSEITEKKTNWEWHYKPQERTFNDILEEFTQLFEQIIIDRTHGKKILLPISGGLDSRTLFVPMSHRKDLTLASYEFENGICETWYGEQLAKHYNIPFFSQKIPNGYLWNTINKTAEKNECFSDFLHPRQVAVQNNWKGLGDNILLGHWGDVLFDTHAESENYSLDEQVNLLQTKILHNGGVELASDLWDHWGLEGSFKSYISERVDFLYRGIEIDHPSARTRAFKSLYWAPRWTSVNLALFNSLGKVVVPYYHDDMCKFICTIPENFLKGRKIQIEYIKKNLPFAATIPWQKYHPLTLNNYKLFNNPLYYPVRALRKLNRLTRTKNSFNVQNITNVKFLCTNILEYIPKFKFDTRRLCVTSDKGLVWSMN